jgi:hypothetical protein
MKSGTIGGTIGRGLTYRGFVRQIRGALRVAKSHVPSAGGKQLVPRLPSQYRYSTLTTNGVSFEAFGTRFCTKTAVRVSA